MEGSRRDFLKKSLKIGAVGGTMIATAAIANSGNKASLQADSNGVVLGKSSKKEVLYQKSKEWEYYYKIAY
ncbi:twin-arginine translocation signal domain-containing protein [Campylobacter sp. CCUG 57310]|uniref:twin-arginine translocation signal domain-containing protein n=1 Tax=Campylobacter sp. CCUG 57310 TaxID=2517362 RepID=UPI0015638DBA|nr:twin-arginine translocation signal domain-containing protein [Campylobacter sp. CCUG 57310]QKF91429.1 putative formate dehydrogenase-associated protein [Campylobacter sp. CCUG 57310]